MEDIVDRLETVTRKFPRTLFYGASAAADMLTPRCSVHEIIHADLTAERLSGGGVVYDEEASPLAHGSFDLIVSLLTLHSVNDLIGALAQARAALRPDGLFIAAMFGEETLIELRRALYEAEAEYAGGVSPRVSPFAAVRDLGGALQRAGFALPVADLDRVRVKYEDIARLFADLRGVGETACLANRGKGLRRDALSAAAMRLAQAETITFDLVMLTGWAPHESQQKPLKPGTAAHSLKDALKGR